MANTRSRARESHAFKVVDPHGDLRLIVGEERVVFQVCSRTLARSSPVWEAMLYGPFSEGKEQQKSQDWKVALPDDNPDAMHMILLVVHSMWEWDTWPKGRIAHQTFFCITIIADK